MGSVGSLSSRTGGGARPWEARQSAEGDVMSPVPGDGGGGGDGSSAHSRCVSFTMDFLAAQYAQ